LKSVYLKADKGRGNTTFAITVMKRKTKLLHCRNSL
jgi:hypothetical protein